MKTLVWVEHDNAVVKDATLAAVTAASSWAKSTSWSRVRAARALPNEAAKIAGVGKVHVADDAAYANALAENVAPLIVELMAIMTRSSRLPPATARTSRRASPPCST
jgi:electron transfer flavoprotein alpha subunit